MKDRSGPGMTTVSTAGEAGGAAAFAEPAFGWSDGEAAFTALPEEAEQQAHRQKKVDREMANIPRGRFIIGYLFENLRASRLP
jgi:hypothetical protein